MYSYIVAKTERTNTFFGTHFILPFYYTPSCVHSSPSNVSLDILFRSNRLGGICCMHWVCALVNRVVGSKMHIQEVLAWTRVLFFLHLCQFLERYYGSKEQNVLQKRKFLYTNERSILLIYYSKFCCNLSCSDLDYSRVSMLFLSLARSLSLSIRVPCSHRSNPLVPPKMFHLCPHLDSTYHPRMSSDAPNLSEGPCCSSRALPPTWLLVLLHPQQIHP